MKTLIEVYAMLKVLLTLGVCLVIFGAAAVAAVAIVALPLFLCMLAVKLIFGL